MTEKTFTAPSGIAYTYEVDETGRFDKNSIIEYTDSKGGYATIDGADLVALAIHWIEGEILELKADAAVTRGITCRHCGQTVYFHGHSGVWRAMDYSTGFDLDNGDVCRGQGWDGHEPVAA